MATSIQYDEHDAPRLTRGVRVLLAINVAMLFLQWTVVSDVDVFAVLGFQDGSLQRTLWSAGTYMFVHFSLWHLALNMYALLLFGPRLESAMGTRAFTLYFLWCGLGGAMFHLVFVRTGLLIGAHENKMKHRPTKPTPQEVEREGARAHCRLEPRPEQEQRVHVQRQMPQAEVHEHI